MEFPFQSSFLNTPWSLCLKTGTMEPERVPEGTIGKFRGIPLCFSNWGTLGDVKPWDKQNPSFWSDSLTQILVKSYFGVEAPVLRPPDVKSGLVGKDPDAGKD